MVSLKLFRTKEREARNNEDIEASYDSAVNVGNTFNGMPFLPWTKPKIPPDPIEPPHLQNENPQSLELRELYKTIYHDSSESLHITVGTGLKATRWIIRKRLICHYSQYFAGAYRSGMAESQTNHFVLAEDNPVAFGLFVDWMHAWVKPKYPGPIKTKCSSTWPRLNPNLWCENAHLAWILADKLLAPEFSRFALMNFILHSICTSQKKIGKICLFIRDNTMEDSALACYTREGWKWKWEELPRDPRSTGGTAAARGNSQPRDPRGFGVDHWYEACGREGGECDHFKRAFLQQHQPREHKLWTCLDKLYFAIALSFFLGAILAVILANTIK